MASRRKTIEVRVLYLKHRDLAAGQQLRFLCDSDELVMRIKRSATYRTLEDLLDAEGPSRVNPDATREEQLASIRRIYTTENEALGVLAIEVEPT